MFHCAKIYLQLFQICNTTFAKYSHLVKIELLSKQLKKSNKFQQRHCVPLAKKPQFSKKYFINFIFIIISSNKYFLIC